MEYKGHLVISTAGHDKGTVFCVLDEDGQYLLLADGRKRKVQKPKRKKIKHIELIKTTAYSGTVTNKAVHAFIREASASFKQLN